jgi:hypothetical protein
MTHEIAQQVRAWRSDDYSYRAIAGLADEPADSGRVLTAACPCVRLLRADEDAERVSCRVGEDVERLS